MDKEEFVFPGQFLSTAEEFTPGENTFEDDSGNISSTTIGKVVFNENEREVSVFKNGRQIKPIEIGSIVIGVVVLVKEKMAIINLLKAEKNGVERICSESNAFLAIARVSSRFVSKLNEELKIGDIIKAEVIAVTRYSIDLTTAKPNLGVIKAFCSKCRKQLHLFGMQLKCINCGRIEKRILSNEYSLK